LQRKKKNPNKNTQENGPKFCNDAEPLFGFKDSHSAAGQPSSHVVHHPPMRGVELWFQARLFLDQILFAFALFFSALVLYGWCSTFQEVSGPQGLRLLGWLN